MWLNNIMYDILDDLRQNTEIRKNTNKNRYQTENFNFSGRFCMQKIFFS